MMLKNIEKGLTSDEYDTSNLEKGEDDIIKDDKMTITLTTTQNQKNNSNNNMTIIDLGECEISLRKEYNIPDNELLYIKKIDVVQKGMKIPKVEYDVYCKLLGSNLIKLNLTACEKNKIDLSIPIKITESLDKLNSSSRYYNGICYLAVSDYGTDISLKDRKKEFVEGNKTVCQDDCDFSEYDYNTQKAKCSCKVKESTSSIIDMKINKTKLYQNFIDIKNIANINLMVCYKVLFNKKGIINNIACLTIIPIILFHLIVIIIFYMSQKNQIKDKIKDISFGILNWELVREEKKMGRIKKMSKRKKPTKIKNSIKFKDNNIIHSNNIIYEGNKKSEELKILSLLDYYYLNNIINKKNPPNKKRGILNMHINNEYNKNNINIININNIGTDNNNKNKSKKVLNKKLILKKTKDIMAYNDQEINNLPYKLAIKNDKRSYCQYYLSLLKIKHILIFSFYNNNDYNSRIVKIDLFFINFTIYYTVNALFFNDVTMHKIYEDKGSFNIIYQLPQILYSSLISSVLNVCLKLLALSEGRILNFKKNK